METYEHPSQEQELEQQSPDKTPSRAKSQGEESELEKQASIMKVQSISEVTLEPARESKTIEKLKNHDSTHVGSSQRQMSVLPVKNQFSEYENIYKIILIGSSYTGKTSLLIRFVNDIFDNNYLNTVGVDLKSITLKIHGTMARVNIWDTTGQEKFRSMTKAYFRNCQGAIAVFDLTKKESLYSVEAQIREFQNNSPEEAKDNIVLVGNKSDLTSERQVREEEGRDLCQKLGLMDYFETSASTNLNVDKAFFKVAMKAFEIDKLQTSKENAQSASLKLQFKQSGRTSTSLQLQNYDSPERKQKKGKCCN